MREWPCLIPTYSSAERPESPGGPASLAWQSCVAVRNEYRYFRDLRTTFFVRGDPQVARQSLYTIVVENIPAEFRLNVSFRNLFEHMFPGQIFSTEVMQQLGTLPMEVVQLRLPCAAGTLSVYMIVQFVRSGGACKQWSTWKMQC